MISLPAEFTKAISLLLAEMYKDKVYPVLHYCYRSKEEQKRLFDAKLSKCDGKIKLSNHQRMLAADIYLTNESGKIVWEWNKELADQYHEVWERLGGAPMISWDRGHFEWRKK
jgi:hypothetical protein